MGATPIPDSLPRHGHTLTELLVAVAILSLLASLLLPAVTRAFTASRARIRRITAWHSMRVGGFLDDTARESQLMWLATNIQLPYLDITTNTVIGR